MRCQRHAPAALYPGKKPLPIVQEARWAPGPSGQVRKNLASTRIRSPDCPFRNQSLYLLSYPTHDRPTRWTTNKSMFNTRHRKTVPFYSPKHPYWLWGTQTSYASGTGFHFLGIRRAKRKADHILASIAELEIAWCCTRSLNSYI